MIVRKLTGFAVAAALTMAPTMAFGAPLSAAVQNSDARASAQLEGESALSGSSAPVFLGLILVVLFVAVAVSDNGDDPNNPVPTSP